MGEFLSAFIDVVIEVALAVTPLAAVALVFNLKFLQLPRTQSRSLFTGLLLTALGTMLFLYGVRIGFMPRTRHGCSPAGRGAR